ncbi:MAG: hypothetical protein KBS56_01755 [Clostridiales bacterium]|nr:hypothetical protein [Candidatus Crickella equi]
MSEQSIKIMSLLDELEELVTSSSKMPFSEKGIIDLDYAQKVIDDIRMNLPRDIQEAQWVQQEKDRIINDAKSEYNKVIVSAKEQAEYLIDSDAVKREAQKRADALIAEAESHANYIKLRTYEYIDKLLFDMQNDIASVTGTYLQPMNDYFQDMVGNINYKVNQNRQEMKTLAERVNGASREEVKTEQE